MHEIICPHCAKAFKIDEAGYADILKQVHDEEFERQLHVRLELAEQEKRTAVQLAEARAASTSQKSAAAKDLEIQELKAKLEQTKLENQAESKLAESRLAHNLQLISASKDTEIQDVRAKLTAAEIARKLSITEAVSAVERERNDLKGSLERSELERQLSEKALKDKFETQLKDRDEAIEPLRDMKTRLSTKMIGESLEQHCETEFNRIRATAFPKAYFEKDNDARTDSKGDYVFRDADDAGTEIISIMFEMKNESDRTATKNRNEDFLKELDKDRTEKGCEYGVLVSMLEPESELYNTGIVSTPSAEPCRTSPTNDREMTT